MRDGIAVTKPNFVVTRVSEIPPQVHYFLDWKIGDLAKNIYHAGHSAYPSRGAVAAVTAINGSAFSSLT